MLRAVAMAVPGWPVAFPGSLAVAAGLTTWGRLRGPRFRRLFPDVYCAAGDRPPDLRLRSLGAYRLSSIPLRRVHSALRTERPPRSGSARGARCAVGLLGGPGARRRLRPAPGRSGRGHRRRRRQRVHPRLAVRRDRIAPGETIEVGDVRCTGPLRTAYDLGRQDDLVEAVVAVDRLANQHRFAPDLLLHFTTHYRGGPGTARLCRTLAHADAYAGSPMETRLRMIIVRAALPPPRVQWVVQDVEARTAVWLDMAWPEQRIAAEFEGEGHAAPTEVLRDVGRYTRLVDRGWRIYRYTKYDVYCEPGRIVAELTRALERL